MHSTNLLLQNPIHHPIPLQCTLPTERITHYQGGERCAAAAADILNVDVDWGQCWIGF